VNGQETDEEENGTYTEEEVKVRSHDRVAEYLEEMGVERKHCNAFRDQDVNGKTLLGLDRNFMSPTQAPWVSDYGPG
jgi:hypothetical protein